LRLLEAERATLVMSLDDGSCHRSSIGFALLRLRLNNNERTNEQPRLYQLRCSRTAAPTRAVPRHRVRFCRFVASFALSSNLLFRFCSIWHPRLAPFCTKPTIEMTPFHSTSPPSQQDVSGSHAPLRRAAPVKQLASKRSIRWFDFFDFHSPILIYLVLLFAMLFFLMNFEYSTAQSASAATPLSGATVRFEPIDRNCFLFFAHRLSPTTTRRTNEPTTKHSLVVGYRSSHRSSVAAPIRQAP
jgi:hypothetical protein